MADISVTAGNVAVGGSNVPTRLVQFGEAVTQGQPVYRSDSDSKYYQGDASAEGTAKCDGIVLTAASTDGYGVIVTPSTELDRSLVNLGATLVVGETYVVSATKGGIAPIGDLLSTEWACVIGTAKTAAILDFQVILPPAAKA